MDEPYFCDRCSRQLTPGAGDLYVVTIDAVADPFPQSGLAEELSAEAIRAQIESLLQRAGELSEREAMDEVHRRVTLWLCVPCFRRWIENPCPSV
ncbi:MAG TPA: hypothetical protein VKA46_30695 [Gemmataceae bacterium]|nr:hypothetical protein [Gemmataceae bacterium]